MFMKWQVQYYTQQHNVYEVASSVLYTAAQCLWSGKCIIHSSTMFMKWQVQYYTQQHNVYEVVSSVLYTVFMKWQVQYYTQQHNVYEVASSVLYTAAQCLWSGKFSITHSRTMFMKWQVQYYTQQHNVYEVASSVLYTAAQCLWSGKFSIIHNKQSKVGLKRIRLTSRWGARLSLAGAATNIFVATNTYCFSWQIYFI